VIGHLPSGTRGFDCDRTLTTDIARFMYGAGYRFAMRYVGRMVQKVRDLTDAELDVILRAGLAIGVVQHVALEGWTPDAALGTRYGKNAAIFARDCDYGAGATLWCDLEGVKPGTPARDVIGYCNRWYDAVAAAGYQPGLYVGWHAGLGARDLYYMLRFAAYWSSYNLDADAVPAVRGVQLRQHAAGAADRVPAGWKRSDIDVNLIGRDALGDSPLLMLAPGDR
jgi:hypothetical protein